MTFQKSRRERYIVRDDVEHSYKIEPELHFLETDTDLFACEYGNPFAKMVAETNQIFRDLRAMRVKELM